MPRVRSSRRLAALVVASALVFAPLRAQATTVVPITVEALARRADDVLVVTPRSATSHWMGREIVTDYDLVVESVIRGNLQPGAHVTLRAPGGVVDRIGQQVPGVMRLETGRPYLVFLSRAEDGAVGIHYLTHLTASILPLTAESDGTVTVSSNVEGLRVATNPTGTTATRSEATVMRREGIALDQLVRVLRGAP
jgi:hypothetical protein